MKLEDLTKVADEETPATLIGPGSYTVTITDAVEGASSKGTPCIELDMEIMDGEYKGRGLKDWVYVTDAAMWRVKQLLKAAQYPFPEGEFDFPPAELIGRKVDLDVRHEVYNGQVKTRVDEYRQLEGWDPSQVVPPAPADDGVPF